MLRPADTATRERKNLNGIWKFRLDTDGVGREQGWQGARLADSVDMAVPASFNDLFTDLPTHDFFGDIWYQTDLVVPRGWAGQRILLHFESATHRATVWVNDTEVVSHEDIHEFNFDARYVLDLKNGLSLGLGPTLSLFHSRAKIGTRATPRIRSFSDTDLSLGGALRLNYQINERWSAGLGYRYAAPTDRHFHIVSLDASYKF